MTWTWFTWSWFQVIDVWLLFFIVLGLTQVSQQLHDIIKRLNAFASYLDRRGY
jgi:hypothetical protein